MRIQTGVSIIMNRWLEVDRNELVLFITDETHLREAQAVDAWARSSDSVLKTVVLPSDKIQNGTAISEMEEQLCRANVIIGATDYSFITTP
ncbi:MAG: peptidase, partial [Oscillospiraceae bacterium]|nr:peptidase [Oscillospiraceae bacterium]